MTILFSSSGVVVTKVVALLARELPNLCPFMYQSMDRLYGASGLFWNEHCRSSLVPLITCIGVASQFPIHTEPTVTGQFDTFDDNKVGPERERERERGENYNKDVHAYMYVHKNYMYICTL